jgi:hypothetical protein
MKNEIITSSKSINELKQTKHFKISGEIIVLSKLIS